MECAHFAASSFIREQNCRWDNERVKSQNSKKKNGGKNGVDHLSFRDFGFKSPSFALIWEIIILFRNKLQF